MEVEAEGGKSIMTLANAKFLLHSDQPGRALGAGIARQRGWKGKGNIDNIIIRGGRNQIKFRLVHPLKFAELHELTAERRALFDNAGREIVRVMFRDLCA